MSKTAISPKSNPAEAARKLNFTGFIDNIHDGHFATELNEAHRDMVEHMMTRSGKGKITITLDYAPADDKGVNIVADVVVKKPKRARRAQFAYADENGQTYLDDPTQTEMELGSVVKFDAPRSRASGE